MPTASWRVLIADDEPAARRGVRHLLAQYPDFTVVGECRDGRQVLSAIDTLKPDVLFLDIQMPEIDGLEVTRRRAPEHMPALIFLTAFDQFALDAFDAAALDYLVKPVSEARFATAMKRLNRWLRRSDAAPRAQSIVVTTGGQVEVIPLADIDWIEAADYYARLWVGGRSYLIRESLSELEARVGGHGFARAHRQALVRLDGVRALRTNDDGDVVAVLACGATVPVSRRRRAEFAAALRATATRNTDDTA